MEVGAVYKLDHSRLPESVVSELGHAKSVMVRERTRNRVRVGFPSKASVEGMVGGMMEPDLDREYVMNVNLAETVLVERVSFEEYATRRGSRGFWMEEEGEGLRWGLRKRVRYVRREREEEEMKEEEEEEEEEMEMERRKRRKVVGKGKKKKKKKRKRGPVEVGMGEVGDVTLEANFRWTLERYKKAEKGILKIMKTKEAYHGHPILRADLRTEARKLIGDTGLLDHLLKHMAGKIAPGGKERFRRRHNSNGAMEYWLESADLESIRKEAGVDDTYWIPPEGWKLGDSPTQDPVCAKELKKLREDVDTIKSKIQELHKENLGPGKGTGDVPAICLDDVESMRKFLLMPLTAMQEDLLKRRAKINEQLLIVAKELSEMEEGLRRFELKAKGRVEGAIAAPTGAINEGAGEMCSGEKESEKKEETKAARRQRLKSGFSICKPNGTFLWPSDISAGGGPSLSAQNMIQIDDFLAVSSPSSVCSSKSPLSLPPPPPPPPSAATDNLLLPPPPPAVLRPVAKRPSLGVSVPTVSRGYSGSSEVTKDTLCVGVLSPTASSANSLVFVPDLNEVPLDGHPTNVDSPCFAKSPFLSSIQGTHPFHPSGGMIAQGAPASMNHATTSTTRLLQPPATQIVGSQNSRVTDLPLTYVRSAHRLPKNRQVK